MGKKATVPLEVAAMVLLGVAAVVAWTGGWRTEVLGLTLSLRSPGRLATFGLALAAVRAAMSRDHLAPAGELSEVASRVIAGAMLAAALAGWAAHLSPYVGGADSYGYVSTADRIRRGTLIQVEPLAALLPYANRVEAATPLGYVGTARAANSSVPAYPLGLPALMAGASVIAGPRAPLFVTPLMGLLLIGVCCCLSYRLTLDATAALATGAVVALHPVVFTYAIQPMSDVPATAFYLLAAALLLLRGSPASAVIAGISGSLAFLIRPALVPGIAALVVIPGLSGRLRASESPCLRGKGPLARAIAFGAVTALGVAVQAWSQWHLYGSPLANGYGPASELFGFRFLPGNTRSYLYWLYEVHGFWWIVGVIAAMATLGTVRDRFLVVIPLLAVAAPYAVYRTYDHWETLRFVLPVLVAATVAAVAAVFLLLGTRFPRIGQWLAIVAVAAISIHSVRWLDREHVFDRALSEERFQRAGELVSRATPGNAVVLASLHSGSVRYYSQRQTLDWARIPEGEFVASVAALKKGGHPVFVMLDGQQERTEFEARHGHVLDSERWLPSGQVRDVRLYEAPR